jgi:Tfp pilus assembly protein PilN
MSLINLLPDDYLRRQAQKRANLLCAGLFAVVMAGVLVAVAISERGYRNTRAICERVNASYADAEKLIGELQELESTRAKMYAKANRTSSLLEKMPRSNLIAAITNALPEGSSLMKVELKSSRGTKIVANPKSKYEQVKAKAIGANNSAANVIEQPPRQVSLTVTGLAGTDVEVARFITSMAQCPMVQPPDLVYSQEKKINDVNVREFQVVMIIKTDLPADKGDTALASADSQGGKR